MSFGYYSIFKPLQTIWLWYFSYLWMNYHKMSLTLLIFLVSSDREDQSILCTWVKACTSQSASVIFSLTFSPASYIHAGQKAMCVYVCVCAEEQLHNPRVNTECYKWDCLWALSLKDQIVIHDKHFSKSCRWIPACFDDISLTMFQWIVLYSNGA